MTDPDAPEVIDPVVLAGEYALGLLEGTELGDAKRRLLADPGFAGLVAWWEDHFAGLHDVQDDAALAAPPIELWSAIDQQIEGALQNGSVTPLPAPSPAGRGWNIAALASAAALAGVALLLYVGMPSLTPGEPVAPAQMQAQLIAQMSGGEGGPALTTRIDPTSRMIALKSAGMGVKLAANMAPELWVIPAGGAPHSLGMVPMNGTHERELTSAEAAMIVEGATLAITYEPRDGAPHRAPSSAPVMAAALVKI